MITASLQGDELTPDSRIGIPCYKILAPDFNPKSLTFVDELIECLEIEPVKYPTPGKAILTM